MDRGRCFGTLGTAGGGGCDGKVVQEGFVPQLDMRAGKSIKATPAVP